MSLQKSFSPILSPKAARWFWTQKKSYRLAGHRQPILVEACAPSCAPLTHPRAERHLESHTELHHASHSLLKWVLRQKIYSRILWVTSTTCESDSSGSGFARSVVHLTAGKYSSVLGQEFDCVIFDMFSGLHPDAFTALSGTLTAGGAFILVGPSLHDWPRFADPEYHRLLAYPQSQQDINGHFLHYLSRHISQSKSWAVLNLSLLQDSSRLEIRRSTQVSGKRSAKVTAQANGPEQASLSSLLQPSLLPSSRFPSHAPPGFSATGDQQKLIQRVLKMSPGRRNALVVTAGRGRGKSSGLGLAISQWLEKFSGQIWVTAPSKATLHSFYRFLADTPDVRSHPGEHSDPRVHFYAPDDLLQTGQRLSPKELPALVIVDEAAAIPTSLLKAMASTFPRLIFATTTHGYEGTGQGFALKFFPVLSSLFPRWKATTLKHPVRWQPKDPLEDFIEKSFILDNQPVHEKSFDEAALNAFSLRRLKMAFHPAESLCGDQHLLDRLMRLLTIAHYRTTPDDLRTILDAPGVRTYSVTLGEGEGEKVVAAALISMESPFTDPTMIDAIWQGQRRPRGHLLQQSLAQQLCIREGLGTPVARVIRIAVHPLLQHKGIGSWLLNKIMQHLKPQVSLIGASFAGEPDVVKFWLKNGYHLVRMGSKRDHVSGTYAAMVLCPMSPEGKHILRAANIRFQRRSHYDLHFHKYPHPTSEILEQALLSSRSKLPSRSKHNSQWPSRQKLYEGEEALLALFADGARPLENIEDLLTRLPGVSAYPALKYLRHMALKQESVELQALASQFSLTGRKQAVQLLRTELKEWLAASETSS